VGKKGALQAPAASSGQASLLSKGKIEFALKSGVHLTRASMRNKAVDLVFVAYGQELLDVPM
jgi:hypothetical protein